MHLLHKYVSVSLRIEVELDLSEELDDDLERIETLEHEMEEETGKEYIQLTSTTTYDDEVIKE